MTRSSADPDPAVLDRAGRREWIGLAVLSLPAFLASLELTVTHLALPAIGRALAADSAELLWIVDVYAFLLAGSLITMGTLGDRIGRRRLLLIGAAAYGIASVLAAYAPSAGALIAIRALLGISGATLMPSVLSLTVAMFRDPRQRTVAVGIVIASVSGGTAIGPLVGGWLLERFWWGSVFLLGVPVMALLLVLGPILLPERRYAGAGRLDPISAVLSLAAVLVAVYGLKQMAADGPGPLPVFSVTAGLLFAVIFVRRQRALRDPLINLRLFANRAFSTAVATLAFGIFVLWGFNYAFAQYLQLVRGLSPLEAGLWTAPSAVGVIIGSTLASRIVRWTAPGPVIAVGLALAATGFVVVAQVGVPPVGMTAGTGDLAILVAGAVIVSAGLGPMMALATDMAVGVAPPEQAGAASAISSTAPQLGGALGIAVLGSAITAVYRDEMSGGVVVGFPAGAASAATESLAGAVAASRMLPDRLGDTLLGAARQAFTAGFQLSALVSAAIVAVMAVTVAVMLGRGRVGPKPTTGR
ncbi:MFS transporter [Streptosporangium sp. NPDC000509]|uniref:MFS transporter n=1 Tax=Streptosporangium sp. NPDC000509 TaxID=3366186 RepID=UPI0036CDC3A6